jgi:FlaA1/EpsC-like NDP-sugar epimerase
MRKSLSRRPTLRLLALGGAYFAVLSCALCLSLLLRFDFVVPSGYWTELATAAVWILPLKFLLLYATGQFRTLLTFFSLPDAKSLAWAMGLAAAIVTVVWFFFDGRGIPPRGVILTDAVVSFGLLVALRVAMRRFREQRESDYSGDTRKKTLIVGAGVSGASLFKEAGSKRGFGLQVVAFVDDNPAKIGGTLHGAPVLGPTSELPEIARRLQAEKIVMAMPKAPPSKIKALVAAANELHLEHDILPSVGQLLSRRVTVTRLRPVEPEDLLGRTPVKLDDQEISSMLRGRTALVTGAGGSIGSELCRQIAAKRPMKLVLLERSEPALFSIYEELRNVLGEGAAVPLAIDICDEDSMEKAFAAHTPEIVFHAAAHKHVPLMEQQPPEAFRNNVLGTGVVARLAGRHGAARFVFISTDKAVNPSSVMGATKRLAELVARAALTGKSRCISAAVRFGNVLGSSGSVVQVFHRQIAAGGPLTVTDPDATRFFMTIPEAAGLILQSALLAEDGETFMLEMGAPVKIDDLARQMIELAGFAPGRDIEIAYTGLRAGEKLHEETVAPQESLRASAHSRIHRVVDNNEPAFGESEAKTLHENLLADDTEGARRRLLKTVSDLQGAARLRIVKVA